MSTMINNDLKQHFNQWPTSTINQHVYNP